MTVADALTADSYVVQFRCDGRWTLPDHDEHGATMPRDHVNSALRGLRGYGLCSRYGLSADGCVYASNNVHAVRYLPASFIAGHRADRCPACGTANRAGGGACTALTPPPVAGGSVLCTTHRHQGPHPETSACTHPHEIAPAGAEPRPGHPYRPSE